MNESKTEKHFCVYCGSDLAQELSEINWPEVMAIEDQIPDPDDLPVTLDLDTYMYCRDCEHEYLVKARVHVTGDVGKLISQTIENPIGDDDKRPAYCQACGAELVAVLPDLDAWVCPVCKGLDTTNIPITSDCPHCGFPCHREHIDVVRCVNCNTLDFEQAGMYVVETASPFDPERMEKSCFYCGDCYDELFPEEEEAEDK